MRAARSKRRRAATPPAARPSMNEWIDQRIRARGVRRVHRIDIADRLPVPDLLAAELAPEIAAGGRIEFVQIRDGYRHAFDHWDWLIMLDEEMHRLGVPRWADAVAEPLYVGQCYIGHGHWEAAFCDVANVVNGELSASFQTPGLTHVRVYSEHGDAMNWLYSAGSYRADPSRWEPTMHRNWGDDWTDAFGGSSYSGTISFRDNREGRKLADLVFAEMADEAALASLAADAEAEQ
jgi:hypothetical protein